MHNQPIKQQLVFSWHRFTHHLKERTQNHISHSNAFYSHFKRTDEITRILGCFSLFGFHICTRHSNQESFRYLLLFLVRRFVDVGPGLVNLHTYRLQNSRFSKGSQFARRKAPKANRTRGCVARETDCRLSVQFLGLSQKYGLFHLYQFEFVHVYMRVYGLVIFHRVTF